jgi:sugar fermentation stimulation protein A
MPQSTNKLPWPPLIPGTLIKRYKRFLADIELDDGTLITAHCPNSGSMRQCSEPGQPVYVSRHDNPRRKLKFTWQLIQMPTSLVGVNTLVPNRLVGLAATQGLVPELKGYGEVRAEVTTSPHTRLDFRLKAPRRRDCYIEVKNCTLVEQGTAMFPDARTARGQKHLQELISLRNDGCRAIIFFVIQRTDALRFAPADAIDPDYGRWLRLAAEKKVELMAYDVTIDLQGIAFNQKIPIQL